MKVVKTVKEVREIVAGWRKEGLSVGLVPTMGSAGAFGDLNEDGEVNVADHVELSKIILNQK